MITKRQAQAIINENVPGADIQAIVEYKGNFLAQVFSNRPFEERLDPFYILDRKTGALEEFSILTDGNWREVFALLKKEKGETDAA